MWFSVVRKILLPFSSYTVQVYLAHGLKSCVEPRLPLLVNPKNRGFFSNYFKYVSRELTVKSDVVENTHKNKGAFKEKNAAKKSVSKKKIVSGVDESVCQSNDGVKKGRAKESTLKRDSIPKKVIQYFISNGMEELLDVIPKQLLNIKRRSSEMSYIFNKNVAGTVMDAITVDLLQNDSPILEINPGFGFITKKLLDIPVSRIQLYEPSHEFRLHLNDLVENNSSRVSMTAFNFFSVSKVVFQDKLDSGNRLHTLLQELPRKEWTDEPAMRIIGVLPSLRFMKYLMMSLISQSGLMTYGRPEFYLIMEPVVYTHLTCDGKIGYLHYRTSSVLFQLIFQWKILAKLPKEAIFPWYSGRSKERNLKLEKVCEENAEWRYLVKCVPRQDFFSSVVPPEQLRTLWHFVRQNMSSRNRRIVPQLEKWIPGCGPRLIVKGMGIFCKFGDLSPQEMLSLFHDFVSWPEYSDSPFLASVEYACLKMEPGSDDMDEVPERKGSEEVDDDDASQEISGETDQNPP